MKLSRTTQEATMTTVKPIRMHCWPAPTRTRPNPPAVERIVWCVVAPSGRIIAERMTEQSARRVAAKREGERA